ncbi:MAG: GntR family transcriptional regulator [Acidimicrobiales bacterium]
MIDLGESVAGSRRTAHELVRDSLRAAILGGSVKGGTRLVQADLARELGVSTTPVREALRDLASEGLISLDAHRGAMVRQFDYEELVEIHDLARILEPEAMRLAAKAEDRAFLDQASSLADQMEAEADVGHWVDLNRQFHASLVASVRNRRMHDILTGLRDTTAPYVGMALQQHDYRRGAANRHHRQLIEALRDGDGDQAARIAIDHVDLTIQQLELARHVFDPSTES